MNVVKHHSVTAQQSRLVYDRLEQGERLLLMAPIDFRASSTSGVSMVFFGFLWLVLCTALVFCLRDGIIPADYLTFFILFITLGTLGGLAGLCLPFYMGRMAGNTVIAVTDRRVLGIKGDQGMSWPLSDVKRFYYRERTDKSGGIGIDFRKPVYVQVAGFGLSNGVSPLLCPLPDVARLVRDIMASTLPRKPLGDIMQPAPGHEPQLASGSRLRIERQLDPDERILWAARPRLPGLGLLFGLRVFCCLMVGASWFAAVKSYGDAMSASILWLVNSASIMTLLLILLSVIPTICKWRSRLYAITGKRALMIGKCLNGDTEVASYPADRTEILERRTRRNGSGDLVLFHRLITHDGQDSPHDDGLMHTPRVDEAAAVFEQVRAAMRKKGAKAEASAPQ